MSCILSGDPTQSLSYEDRTPGVPLSALHHPHWPWRSPQAPSTPNSDPDARPCGPFSCLSFLSRVELSTSSVITFFSAVATLHSSSSARLAPPYTQLWGHSPSELPVACWQPSVWVSIPSSLATSQPPSCPQNPAPLLGPTPWGFLATPLTPTVNAQVLITPVLFFSPGGPLPKPKPNCASASWMLRGSRTPDWLLHAFLCLEPFEGSSGPWEKV